jgi:hypothetical protein
MNPIKTAEEPRPPVQSQGVIILRPSGEQISECRELQLVEWDVDDPGNPRNWSHGFKYWITLQLGMLAFAASIGSSITAPATASIAANINVSHEVAALSVSLYM